MPSRISASQTWRCSSSGSRIITTSPREAASTTRQHLQALLASLGDRGGVITQADDDLDAGVLEVERVGVTLRAVADDRDGLAVEEMEVRVVVVKHRERAGYPTHALADATRVRPGIASVPSGAAYGARRAARPARISEISGSGRLSTAS